MPSFSNRPPVDPRGAALPLVRTPASKPLTAVIISEDLLGCHTHFYRGRTMPCDAEDCKACHDGLPFRWHAWMAAFFPDTRKKFLFECTAQAAENFVHYRDGIGTLRGCHFRAHRPSRQPNGRVYVDTKPIDPVKIILPDPPDVLKCLAILWNLAMPQVDVAGILKETPHVRISPTDTDNPFGKRANGQGTQSATR